MNTLERKKKVEIRYVDDSELPPIVITMNEEDEPKAIVNNYHRIWISLNRRLIAGIIENLQEQMDNILSGYLKEQRNFELEDRAYEEQYWKGSENMKNTTNNENRKTDARTSLYICEGVGEIRRNLIWLN